MALGRKLKRLRERRGLAQRTLASRAGLPVSYVGRVEAGEITSPTVATRRKLAEALGVPITALLD